MVRDNSKPVAIKVAVLTAMLGVLGAVIGGPASAGCHFGPASKSATLGGFKPSRYRSDEPGRFIKVSDSGFWGPSIVGLWKVEFIALGNTNGIPDGALIDFGTAQWNEDGTESMVSGGRNPSDGDVCMGAWVQVGRATFKLNHLGLAWSAGAYVGPGKISETVTLDPSGNSFHGSFSITQYQAAAAPGQEFQENPNSIVAPTPIYGTITGNRITAN
jgi:hypothetical protein